MDEFINNSSIIHTSIYNVYTRTVFYVQDIHLYIFINLSQTIHNVLYNTFHILRLPGIKLLCIKRLISLPLLVEGDTSFPVYSSAWNLHNYNFDVDFVLIVEKPTRRQRFTVTVFCTIFTL